MYSQTEERIANDLRIRIENELNRIGLLFRAFSRAKQKNSINRKYENKPGKYTANGKKIQDIYGIRIALYFPDDNELAQSAIKNIFEFDPTSSTIDAHESYIFSATRCNLIFKLPKDLANESGLLAELDYIDATFEVQLRTVLSEGWHEVDHDLRYKCKEDWIDHNDLNRALNGIYASLEIADWSMMKLFEELAYRHYKAKEWSQMVRTKFRIRAGTTLRSELIEILNNDLDLGKELYRLNRNIFLKWVLQSKIDLPVTLDNIIFMCNHFKLSSRNITDITPEPVLDRLNDIAQKQNCSHKLL